MINYDNTLITKIIKYLSKSNKKCIRFQFLKLYSILLHFLICSSTMLTFYNFDSSNISINSNSLIFNYLFFIK